MTSLVATHYVFSDFPFTPTAVLDLAVDVEFLANIADAGTGKVVGYGPEIRNVETGDIITVDLIDASAVTTRAFTFIATDITEIAVDPEEDSALTVTLEGAGHLAVYKRGVIGPPGGTGRAPIVLDVVYDYTHPDFDDSGPEWVFANDLMSVNDAQAIADGGGGFWPLPWSKDMPNGRIIGPTAGTSLTAPVGNWYGRDGFTTTYEGAHLLFFTADNAGSIAIDGKPIASVGGSGDITTSGFGSSFPTVLTLSAGFHTVAFEVTNYPPFGGPNPSGIAAQIFVPGFPPTLVWQVSGGTKINDYPAETPGMTPGTVLRLITEQQAGRDWADNIVLGFDDVNDTDGNPWPTFAQIAAKVGSDDCYSLIQKIQAVYADIEMDPAGWTLNAWIWGARNPTSGLSFTEGGNLTALSYQRTYTAATELLISWAGGWAKDGTGDVQAFLQLGPENTAEEIGRIGDQIIAIHGNPREQVTLAYEDDTQLPWSDSNLVPGSTVTVPARTGGTVTERAMQIGCSFTSESERVIVTMVVGDVILATQERLLNAINGAGK